MEARRWQLPAPRALRGRRAALHAVSLFACALLPRDTGAIGTLRGQLPAVARVRPQCLTPRGLRPAHDGYAVDRAPPIAC